jgi:CoA:oxalate CoA-transferase
MQHLPLKGIIVLEFCQYLSGPSAGLRLADMGARVIKIERPGKGDAGRKLSIKNLWVDDNSLLFHTINRNKESFTADLKSEDDLGIVKQLIKKADVLTHNFRPGIMEKTGLDYASVQQMNPRIIYGAISGYGEKGPWTKKPGQDLLLQSISGLTFSSGNYAGNPTPFGLSIADILCGAQLVQGILAALIRRHKTGKGALVEISLLESLLDMQFELLTTYFASPGALQRSALSNGSPLLGAPYGIYRTKDGYIAIAMVKIPDLAEALHCKALATYTQQDSFRKRDEIKSILAAHLLTNSSAYWLEKMHLQDLWAMEVTDWQRLVKRDGYKHIEMEQELLLDNGRKIITTRCPVRINGKKLLSAKPAPRLGADSERIRKELIK